VIGRSDGVVEFKLEDRLERHIDAGFSEGPKVLPDRRLARLGQRMAFGSAHRAHRAHGTLSKIWIAGGNYPAWNTLGPNADLVSLHLSPGVVNC
jgi:hypothetical protein